LVGHNLRVIVLSSGPASELMDTSLSLEEEEALIDEMIAGDASLPTLPEIANSREWIYGNHD